MLANPPFNISDWGGDRLRDDVRWKFNPHAGQQHANCWVQHMVHHLSPSGIAAFVLANGSMSSNSSGEGKFARRWSRGRSTELDCMIALPETVVFTTQIPVCLWFLPTRNKEHWLRLSTATSVG